MPGHGDCDHGVCRDGEAVGSDGGGDDCDFHVGANDCDGDDGFGGDGGGDREEYATVVEMVQLLMVHVMEVMVMEAIVMEVMLVEVMEVKVMVVEVSVGRG